MMTELPIYTGLVMCNLLLEAASGSGSRIRECCRFARRRLDEANVADLKDGIAKPGCDLLGYSPALQRLRRFDSRL